MEGEEPLSPTTMRAGSISSTDHKVTKFSAVGAGGRILSPNPRSCVTCRRRKVKCDKRHPCSNCSKAGIECIFPAPGRAPRKPRLKPADPDLAERLRRLESLVQSLGGTTQGPTTDEDGSKSPQTEQEDGANVEKEETHDEKIWRAKKELRSLMREKWDKQEKLPRKEDESVEELTNRFGTLIADDVGRSRYISPGLWASLTAAVSDMSLQYRLGLFRIG
jgi:hypothetical protein